MRIPFENSTFSLDVSGIAGFFGGEESFAAMTSVHLVRGRRWLGWYNSPGSYYVGKKYGTLARSRIWDGLFPGTNVDPSILLELDGKIGPRYIGMHSGTRLATTGHLAQLLTGHCESRPSTSPPPDSPEYKEFRLTPFGTSNFTSLTLVQLGTLKLQGAKIPNDYFIPFDPVSILPIAVSIGCAVVTAIFKDWYCFAMILVGVVCNGVSCYVLGSGSLELSRPDSSKDSPDGDGILIPPIGGQLVILKGDEEIISSIIRGKYVLRYTSEDEYNDIGFSSLALTGQFLLQLLLIPQGTLFGQIMFLITFAVSWAFNAYTASVDREELQMKILTEILNNPTISKFQFSKWTTAVAFAVFILEAEAGPDSEKSKYSEVNARRILDELIPNDTATWRIWKARMERALRTETDPKPEETFQDSEDIQPLDAKERNLLKDLLGHASKGYQRARDTKIVV